MRSRVGVEVIIYKEFKFDNGCFWDKTLQQPCCKGEVEGGGKRGVRKKEERGTHGKERILYNMPILTPICAISDICATHGVTTDTKEPDRNP